MITSAKKFGLFYLLVCMVFFAGCGSAAPIVEGLRSELNFTILVVNLAGTREDWSGQHVNWKDRYHRIANWMRDKNVFPDAIILQEVHGRSDCPLGVGNLPAYETLFTLVEQIHAETNKSYRIAYLAVRSLPVGACSLYAGSALLYNPDRITNRMIARSVDQPQSYDSTDVNGFHLRESLPCRDTTEAHKEICNVIDGAGLAYTFFYHFEDGSYLPGPVFARLELKKQSRSVSSHI